MDNLERLLAIEEIRKLKARYCRLLDEKKMDEWSDVFTPDALMVVPEGIRDPQEIYGPKAIVDFVGGLLQTTVCVHHIHGAEIEILSDNEATGIWAIDDTVLWPSDGPTPFGLKRLHMAGHYRDKFRLTDKGWRLSESRVTQVPLEQA